MTDQTPIAPGGIGAEITEAMTIDAAMEYKPGTGSPEQDQAAIAALQREVRYRWEQRTALSFRLQDLQRAVLREGIPDTGPLYQALHAVTGTAEAWMHPGTLQEAASFHVHGLKRRIRELEESRDGAYLERNRVVAALAALVPHSGVTKTAIEGWSSAWHNCVYIDLPTGQVSWHFHDDQAPLFAHLPTYRGEWDGHTTEQKYIRLALWAAGGS